MGGDKSWIEKRKHLKMLKSHGAQSSPLKKKLGIINKLRNIGTENFEILFEELSGENMSKFHSEIANSLLANTKVGTEEVHRIVEVIYLYSFDQCFMSYLVASLKKLYLESWANSCIFLEALYLLKKKDLGAAAKSILKNLKDGQTSYIYYALTSFDVDCEIFKEFVVKEIRNTNEKNIENLKKIAAIMHIDQSISLKSDFIDLVRATDHEFDFYDVVEPGPSATPSLPSPATSGLQFSPSMLRSIEKRSSDLHFLDFIGQNIYDKPNLIEKLWRKKKNISLIPSLARIFSKAIKGNSALLASLFSKLEALKPEDLILFSELYKFNIVKAPELFDVLEFYLGRRMIEQLCIILENTGRFLLVNRSTNKQTVDIMERLKNTSCVDVDRIHIANCLSRILSSGMSKMDILDFLQWFLTNNSVALLSPASGLLLADMKRSKKFMLVVFMQPSLFGSIRSLAEMIEFMGMGDFMAHFYLTIIPKLSSKSLVFQIVETLGLLATDAGEQEKCLDELGDMDIDDELRCRSMLMLLDVFSRDLHHNSLEKISAWAKSSNNREVEALLFNFQEKYQYPVEDGMDSFEREMACLREDELY